ncbi:MAG: protein translocase subunit SecF, partial [Actinobacteria bacterium]|nr:protein translocase subunit SecF [Actinomycetota bacterium]NIS34564.1 protein translocase subunit SecF [Actinomycetota bacterium]NIT97590.1 protein translocase subunit SecF [Actinomycetota bacterium]NIU21243.1 protein translocase subunit SecF [Actinomycetota bacterium]NIU69328.1 protein translocase subunit SecF [Actinomycetota bacterium]
SWGDEITDKARNALIWFFVIVAGYIAIRLEWKMAVGALVAVAHDIIISVGVYSLFQFEVTPATVIAFLTIMGYSLYDTIVVYDKVREIDGRL